MSLPYYYSSLMPIKRRSSIHVHRITGYLRYAWIRRQQLHGLSAAPIESLGADAGVAAAAPRSEGIVYVGRILRQISQLTARRCYSVQANSSRWRATWSGHSRTVTFTCLLEKGDQRIIEFTLRPHITNLMFSTTGVNQVRPVRFRTLTPLAAGNNVPTLVEVADRLVGAFF